MPFLSKASSTASKTMESSYYSSLSRSFMGEASTKAKPEAKPSFNTDKVGKSKMASSNLEGLVGGRSYNPTPGITESNLGKDGTGIPGYGPTPAVESQVGKTMGADPNRG